MLLRILLLFCFPLGLYAQSVGRIETDRPDQTECPFIVKKGYFQAEMGFNQSPAETLFPTSLLKIGLTKRLELRYVSVLSKEKDQVTGIRSRSRFGMHDSQQREKRDRQETGRRDRNGFAHPPGCHQ